ncbi:hypothetical protein [Sphingobacterium cellulitidis]|uniref:Uncharacterized protein n=1 Tax=Sphingobacterium cellulitidis TaxID=1768011 RepID=A0A8H9G386_9SPHI|nr:hypothetical protein [Sphingobacterium soli]GGE28277.1 hypothetical protein GCM10011516_27440 [Sphingobacterium soli]
MACKSLTKYTKNCKKVQGGTSELYLIAYSDLTNVEGTLKKYSVDEVSNMVDTISTSSTKKFVKVGTVNNSLAVSEDYSSNIENNSFEINSTITFNISDISAESRLFVQDLADADEVCAIVKLRSGRYVAVGLDGYLSLSAVAGASGVNRGDFNGYSITLSGQEESFSKLVDPTIIASIVEA